MPNSNQLQAAAMRAAADGVFQMVSDSDEPDVGEIVRAALQRLIDNRSLDRAYSEIVRHGWTDGDAFAWQVVAAAVHAANVAQTKPRAGDQIQMIERKAAELAELIEKIDPLDEHFGHLRGSVFRMLTGDNWAQRIADGGGFPDAEKADVANAVRDIAATFRDARTTAESALRGRRSTPGNAQRNALIRALVDIFRRNCGSILAGTTAAFARTILDDESIGAKNVEDVAGSYPPEKR